MQEGIFIAASGAFKQERKLDVIANNLANVNNIGYKKDQMMFEALLPPFKEDTAFDAARNTLKTAAQTNRDVAYVGVAGFSTDFTQGTLERTNNVLDVGLDGPGFFAVETPAGVEYTRKGNFRLDAQGRMINQDGYAVLSEQGGPVTVDTSQGGEISIDSDGNISFGNSTQVTPVGKLKVARFGNPAALEKTGNGLFRAGKDAMALPPGGDTRVRQGFLEQSNVKSVEEMTHMIEAIRAFEAYQKVIQTIDGVDERSANVIGRVG